MSKCVTCGHELPSEESPCAHCGSPNYLRVAQALIKDEWINKKFFDWSLAVFLRDKLRCVYCGKDMLESYDVTHTGSAMDHLLPISKYPELDSPWNIVLACRVCNSLKGAWDPNPNDPPLYFQGCLPDGAVRAKLLKRAKDYLQPRRQTLEAKFQGEQEAIRQALRSLRDGLSTTAAK